MVERDYPNVYKRFTALGPLMDKAGNGGKGIGWNTQTEVRQLGELNGLVAAEGATRGMPRIETDIDACEVVLMLAPETNGHVAVKAWEALGKQTGRDHTPPGAAPRRREDPLPRHPGAAAQDHLLADVERHRERDGLLQRRLHQRARADPLAHAYRAPAVLPGPPVDARRSAKAASATARRWISRPPPASTGVKSNGNTEILLNFITPHQKWGIHSTYTDNLMMLTLSRGGPCIWLCEDDAKRAGIVDNDWVELFNLNGAIAARAVVSQRVNPGMVMMYHAQEKIVNTPGSEITGARGGIHNSVTRIVLKPTHMIGGYAQFSYGFNYYGTIGTNRDEFVVVRKMNKIDWLDTPVASELIRPVQAGKWRSARA